MKLAIIAGTLVIGVVLFSVYFKAAVAATGFAALAGMASLLK